MPSSPRRIAKISAGLGALAGAAALGLRAVRPPSAPPAYVGPAPTPRATGYVSHREVRHLDISPERYVAWAEAAPLDTILNGDRRLPAVVGTQVLRGSWNEPGARRRIRLDGGHFAAEEVLALGITPAGHVFAYEVFGYTNVAGLLADHALGEFVTAEGTAGGCTVTWTYRYLPRSALARPALQVFVHRVWGPYMRSVLTQMAEQAERDG